MTDIPCQPTSTRTPAASAHPALLGPLFPVVMVVVVGSLARLQLGPTLGLIFCLPVAACVVRLGGVSEPARSRAYPRDALAVSAHLLSIDLSVAIVAASFAIGAGSASQTLQLLLVIASLTLSVSSAARALCGLRVPATFSGALCLFVLLAWVAFPVWMSPYWTSSPLLDRVLDCHPLLALNGVYVGLGDWTHAPLAYARLTNLNQDVPFSLPASIAWCVGSHLLIAIALVAIARLLSRRPL